MVLAYRGVFGDSVEVEGNTLRTVRTLRDERGQGLSENVLLIAFVAIASTAAYMSMGDSVGGIWTKTSTQLTSVNSSSTPVTSPSSGGSGTTSGCRDGHHDGCH
jgi:Flp pilus assembly pilin Flp